MKDREVVEDVSSDPGYEYSYLDDAVYDIFDISDLYKEDFDESISFVRYIINKIKQIF